MVASTKTHIFIVDSAKTLELVVSSEGQNSHLAEGIRWFRLLIVVAKKERDKVSQVLWWQHQIKVKGITLLAKPISSFGNLIFLEKVQRKMSFISLRNQGHQYPLSTFLFYLF